MKLWRQRRVHPHQHLRLWAFRKGRLYSKVVLTTGRTAGRLRASILSITTTAVPSTSPATSRPSLVGCGPSSCLRVTKTGPCQSWDTPRCTPTRRSTKVLRTGPLTDSRSAGWKRCSRRVPTGASRAVFPRTASTETTCAPSSQSSTRWLSRERKYAREPSTCTSVWWQWDRGMTHHDSSANSGCEFGSIGGAVGCEDNFGFYMDTNPSFRCSSSDDSTTNHWIGRRVA